MLQQPGQSIVEYIQALKSQAAKCQFSTFTDEALIDQLIFGVSDSSVRKRLLSLEKLTFEEAARLAVQHEAIERDSAIFYTSISQIIST